MEVRTNYLVYDSTKNYFQKKRSIRRGEQWNNWVSDQIQKNNNPIKCLNCILKISDCLILNYDSVINNSVSLTKRATWVVRYHSWLIRSVLLLKFFYSFVGMIIICGFQREQILSNHNCHAHSSINVFSTTTNQGHPKHVKKL